MTKALTLSGGQFAEVEIGQRGVAIVDFGVTGGSDATVTVTGQTTISAQHVPHACVAAIATTDHTADEHLVEELAVRCGAAVPGVGFTIYMRTQNLKLTGRWSVAWSWG